MALVVPDASSVKNVKSLRQSKQPLKIAVPPAYLKDMDAFARQLSSRLIPSELP
jgi:hypothetical protein